MPLVKNVEELERLIGSLGIEVTSIDQLRELRLDRLVTAAERFVFGIADGGRILLIIALIVRLDLSRQPGMLRLGLPRGQIRDRDRGVTRRHLPLLSSPL